jgi:hypothetical protein
MGNSYQEKICYEIRVRMLCSVCKMSVFGPETKGKLSRRKQVWKTTV